VRSLAKAFEVPVEELLQDSEVRLASLGGANEAAVNQFFLAILNEDPEAATDVFCEDAVLYVRCSETTVLPVAGEYRGKSQIRQALDKICRLTKVIDVPGQPKPAVHEDVITIRGKVKQRIKSSNAEVEYYFNLHIEMRDARIEMLEIYFDTEAVARHMR
jgi:ketosteroid isomerase-like protein